MLTRRSGHELTKSEQLSWTCDNWDVTVKFGFPREERYKIYSLQDLPLRLQDLVSPLCGCSSIDCTRQLRYWNYCSGLSETSFEQWRRAPSCVGCEQSLSYADNRSTSLSATCTYFAYVCQSIVIGKAGTNDANARRRLDVEVWRSWLWISHQLTLPVYISVSINEDCCILETMKDKAQNWS